MRVRTRQPDEQTVELSLGQRGPGQVQGGGLALDDACQGLVSERAAPAHVDVAPQTLVAAPARDNNLSSLRTHNDTHQNSSGLRLDVPLVPGLTDRHAGQQLGSVQVSEHGNPDLLLPSFPTVHVLEGRQGQQRRRRQGEGRSRSGGLLFL